MKLGYNTNGLSNHDPFDAIKLLAETGYQSVALTIDHGWLSPRDPNHKIQIQEMKGLLGELGLRTVIETGARFLLDPSTKHAPTLLDDDPTEVSRRIEYLKYCIDVAVELGSDCVSIWSGAKPIDVSFTDAMNRLVLGLREVCTYAEERKVNIGFEPEPGMLIDTTGRFERLLHLYDSSRLKMTLDIGHLFCLSELPIAQYIEKWADRIINVHIEDIKAGVHEHLMFGEGQIHFPPVIESLLSIGYNQGLHVELSRHSHNGAEISRRAYEFLNPIIDDAKANQFDV